MFAVLDAHDVPVGAIGYWTVEWRDESAFETGWFVLPAAQGRGVASRALALLIEDARAHPAGLGYLVAFPAVENAASNGVCRRAGFRAGGSVSRPVPRIRAALARVGTRPAPAS